MKQTIMRMRRIIDLLMTLTFFSSWAISSGARLRMNG